MNLLQKKLKGLKYTVCGSYVTNNIDSHSGHRLVLFENIRVLTLRNTNCHWK